MSDTPRVLRPNRAQMELRPTDLESVLPEDHRARAVERLCDQHDAYRWICGGVRLSDRTLAVFRVLHEEELDGLVTESVVRLVDAKLVQLDRIAQDGMRVRESAGAASFRRGGRLRELEREVQQRVASLRRELEHDPPAAAHRVKAARERAVRLRQERVRRALAKVRQRGRGKPAEKDHVRASTTDPEAQVMQMADAASRAWTRSRLRPSAAAGCMRRR